MGKKYIIYAFGSFFDTAHDTLFKIQTTITSDNKQFFFYILFFWVRVNNIFTISWLKQ